MAALARADALVVKKVKKVTFCPSVFCNHVTFVTLVTRIP